MVAYEAPNGADRSARFVGPTGLSNHVIERKPTGSADVFSQ